MKGEHAIVPAPHSRAVFGTATSPNTPAPALPITEPTMTPETFNNVTVTAKANVYFDGGVLSHSIQLASGEKKTLGMIRPGAYHFDTGAPENMAIIDGECRVKLAGSDEWASYSAGQAFDVPGSSSFDIKVEAGICQYICSFIS